MNLPEDILDDLKRLAGNQPFFTLLNYYKGVPVMQGASLRHVDLSSASVNVHPHQAVCLRQEGRTRLQSKLFSLAVQAEAVVDLSTNVAKLSNFVRVGYLTERRQFVQVEPYRHLESEVLAQNWIAHGRVEDISSAHISLYIPGQEIFFEPEVIFKEYSSLQINVRLPLRADPLNLNGIVTRSAPAHDHDYRVSARLTPDTQTQLAIRDYIQQQQASVAQELQALHEQLSLGG